MLLSDVGLARERSSTVEQRTVRGWCELFVARRWSDFRAVVTAFFGAWLGRLLRHLRGIEPANPYLAGPPIRDASLFVGRRQLVERVMRSVHNNSLFLYGERRIGKTSLLHHLEGRLEAVEHSTCAFHPVFVSLRGAPQELFFATLNEAVFRCLAHRLSGLTCTEASSPSLDLGYRRLAGDLRRVIGVLDRQTTKKVKVVLLIDEIDTLNAYDPRINQRLRSLFMTGFGDNLVAVVAGEEIHKEWEREGSPWYNFFEEIEVPPLAWREAEELITAPVRGGLRWTSPAVELILVLSSGKPFEIQRLCAAAVDRVVARRRWTIRRRDVESVARQAPQSPVVDQGAAP